MPVYGPELVKLMTNVLDETIPTLAINDETPALITHIATSILKAAGKGQTSYEQLLAVAYLEISAVAKGTIVPGYTRHVAGQRSKTSCSDGKSPGSRLTSDRDRKLGQPALGD